MPRIAKVVIPEYPHHITQRGTNKRDIFLDDRTALEGREGQT